MAEEPKSQPVQPSSDPDRDTPQKDEASGRVPQGGVERAQPANKDSNGGTATGGERAIDADRGFLDLPEFGVVFSRLAEWCRRNPMAALLSVMLLLVVGYFYFGVKAFLSLSQTSAQWIAASWNSENDQQHCWAIVPGAILLGLLRWRDLAAARKVPANSGLWWVGAGILLFVAGIRCVEGRYTIFALPLLLYGAAKFLFGGEVARILRFPFAFLLFMTPVGGVVQSTAGLQSLTAKAIEGMCGVFGMKIFTVGATIYSPTNAFEPLEVAGGCSGIRSLMAMMTLAALYAYFVMRTPLRGFILFGCSLLFAMIGNFARVFTVVLVARFIGPKAAHSYHDWSGFVFFPVAVLAMVGVGNVLNRDWGSMWKKWTANVSTPPPVPAGAFDSVGIPSEPERAEDAFDGGTSGSRKGDSSSERENRYEY